MATNSSSRRYTSAQAEDLYLSRLKRTNPSPAVSAVIRDIEKARQERRSRVQRRSRPADRAQEA